jgi:hypothetical protein
MPLEYMAAVWDGVQRQGYALNTCSAPGYSVVDDE